MPFKQAEAAMLKRRQELIDAINNGEEVSVINHARGRYIASLQTTVKAAENEGRYFSNYHYVLQTQLELQESAIHRAQRVNKKNYSYVKEASLGVQELVNAVKQRKYAKNNLEEQEANEKILNAVAKNVKNVVKGPVVLTTKILSTSVAATVMLAPVALGMGILHAAWTAMDSSPSPYDGQSVMKHSKGLQQFMNRIHKGVQKI
jgi:hypothetical protein